MRGETNVTYGERRVRVGGGEMPARGERFMAECMGEDFPEGGEAGRVGDVKDTLCPLRGGRLVRISEEVDEEGVEDGCGGGEGVP